MIEITKQEKAAILEAFPNAHIRRTMKKSSKRHRYYCEESSAVMKFLRERREAQCLTYNGKRGC